MTLTYQVSVEKGLQLGNLESIGLHIIALHLTGSLIFAWQMKSPLHSTFFPLCTISLKAYNHKRGEKLDFTFEGIQVHMWMDTFESISASQTVPLQWGWIHHLLSQRNGSQAWYLKLVSTLFMLLSLGKTSDTSSASQILGGNQTWKREWELRISLS